MTVIIPIAFWGAGGHARVLRDIIDPADFKLVALLDSDPNVRAPFSDVELFSGENALDRFLASELSKDCRFVVAIGGAKGVDRIGLFGRLEDGGLTAVTVVHKSAFIAKDATLGRGSQVLAQSSVCAAVRTGLSCIINTGASIDHESSLGDGVHLGPRATLCGCVEVGDFSFIGAGAVVLPRIRVGNNTIVGAGAVVTRNVPDNVVVVGNPARIIRSNI
jgi:sugar O-acyltransferase (sialic acid O-acetyltransferase NeuD family)